MKLDEAKRTALAYFLDKRLEIGDSYVVYSIFSQFVVLVYDSLLEGDCPKYRVL
mgnify:CR=1 FL=1